MRYLIGLILLTPALYAFDLGHDVRELCRSEVSGYFLQLRSDIEMLDGMLSRNRDMLKELKVTRALKGKDLEKHGDVGPGESLEADERAISLRFEVESLDEQIKDYGSQIATHEANLAARKNSLKDLDKGISGIFEYVKSKDLPEGSYPIKLQYRHSCNQYQQLCPLPAEQADRLKALSEQLKDPKSCSRYANLNRIK